MPVKVRYLKMTILSLQ